MQDRPPRSVCLHYTHYDYDSMGEFYSTKGHLRSNCMGRSGPKSNLTVFVVVVFFACSRYLQVFDKTQIKMKSLSIRQVHVLALLTIKDG